MNIHATNEKSVMKMATLDETELLSDMLNAAKGSLGQKWWTAKKHAETAFKDIGEAILFIEKQRLMGNMSKDKARFHLIIRKNDSRATLLVSEGLEVLDVEATIHAALKAINSTVNRALGFELAFNGNNDGKL